MVVTSALDASNPEVAEARRLQIPVIPRGELLAELMRLKFGIAIAGSHGKTTTTSMVASILNAAEMDPTVVVGGKVAAMQGSNARVGKSSLLVVESDESDGSFLKLAPIVAVVTNIDREHLDHYESLADIQQAFVDFVNKVPFYGAAVLCMEDENIQQIFPAIKRRTITYGRAAQVDLEIQDVDLQPTGSSFTLVHRGQSLGEFQLNVPGIHNVLNATAAVAVGLEMEVPREKIREGLRAFNGVDRRFSIRGVERGVTVVDDYGHHPTEVKATLAAARLSPYRSIHVLFQPHRFSRTKHLLDEFGTAFHQADHVYLLDIYAASEQAIAGVSTSALLDKIRSYGHRSVRYVGSIDEGVAAITGAAEPGDLVITLGAGSVSQAADRILDRLREAAALMARSSTATAAIPEPHPTWNLGQIRWGRFVFWLVVGGFFMLVALFTWRQVEEFLIKDDRFRIPEAEDVALRSPNLKVQGVRYASPSQIRHVFAEDLGRSLYLVPLQQRREQLMAIDWVEEAAISKIWPNTLTVQVKERTPVAFVRLPPARKDGMSQFALIDREGYILRPRVASKFTLPVLTGIREDERLENRRARLRQVLAMLREIGPLADQMSEIERFRSERSEWWRNEWTTWW